MEKEKYLISFESVYDAMDMEDILDKNNIKYKTIPTPREISHSCGLSITLDYNLRKTIEKIIKENSLVYKERFKFINIIGNNYIEKI